MSLTVGQAVSAYLVKAGFSDRELATMELNRFGRWLGMDTPVDEITPGKIVAYQETFAASRSDANQRLAQVKIFLASLSKQQATTDLSRTIRSRRITTPRPPRPGEMPPEPIPMTRQGYERLSAELEDLEEHVRPEVTEQLRSAAADKDFSENAPYSAAKHKLSEVRTRINRIRRTLGAAHVEDGESTDTVELGTVVAVRNLADEELLEYSIVGAGEPLGGGRVSVRSPVGLALLGKRIGEIAEAQTPIGLQRYRIERIDRR